MTGNDLNQKLASMQEAFVDQFDAQMDVAMALWKSIQQQELVETTAFHQLSEIAHQLHGHGSTIGYDEVSDVAGRLGDLLDDMITNGGMFSLEARYRIDKTIEKLHYLAHNAGKPAPGSSNDWGEINKAYKKSELINSQAPKILVIEDAPLMRQKITVALRTAGYMVQEAETGMVGLETAQRYAPDLILLDIKLPGISSFEVQRRLREMDEIKTVPIIFITAISRVNMIQVQEALRNGFSDYIAKPFKIERLLSKISALLAS